MEKEYIVTWGGGPNPEDAAINLEKSVKEYMKEGWKLQGGVSSNISDRVNSVMLFQALSKD